MTKDTNQSSRLSRRTFIGSVGAVITAGVACSSEGDGAGNTATGGVGDGTSGAPPTGTGGASASTGGASPTTGGASPTTGGASQGTGGSSATTGGSSPTTGGSSSTTGGASQGTGGRGQNTGGASQGTGGRDQNTGGSNENTGGSSATTGGTSQGTGGQGQNTGGSSQNTGGSENTAGTSSDTGGATPGEGGTTGNAGSSGNAGSAGSGNTETAYVAMVRASEASADWATATERAIELAGGLPDLTGQTVMLRPNVISADPSPTTTNPEVIRGVIRAVKKKGAATVYVADDGWAASSTTAAMESLGISAVCSEEGATPLDLKGGSTTRMTPPNASAWPNGINFYTAVLDADFVVNVPVCKSHAMANFTMALKAWYGHVPSGDRDHRNLGDQIAELHLARQEDFVVLDATKAMVTGGPQSGTVAEPKIVVASRDPIAADVTGLCIHKHFGTGGGAVANLGVWEQRQITRAMALAFPGWLNAKTDYTYVSEGIDEHAEIMALRDE